jgi:hypothetical protein
MKTFSVSVPSPEDTARFKRDEVYQRRVLRGLARACRSRGMAPFLLRVELCDEVRYYRMSGDAVRRVDADPARESDASDSSR